jgi:hypothetical protein
MCCPQTAQLPVQVASRVGLDSPADDRTIALASSPSDVVRAVSHWLDEFLISGTAAD